MLRKGDEGGEGDGTCWKLLLRWEVEMKIRVKSKPRRRVGLEARIFNGKMSRNRRK